MKQNALEIVYIDIDRLTPYGHNCKIHTKEQIEHIASSIKQFGFNDPLGVWGKENVILEGNGRIEALRLLGIKKAPCIRLDHLSEEDRKSYVIAHNHLNLETGFDEQELLQQLQELQNTVDFESLGIETERYLSKLKELEKKELKPYRQVHYLISLDINDHDKILGHLEQIKKIGGVEIDSTFN